MNYNTTNNKENSQRARRSYILRKSKVIWVWNFMTALGL